jgi:hypothetical protein
MNSLGMTFVFPEGSLQNTFSYNAHLDQWTSTSLINKENGNWVLFGNIILKRGS